MFLTSFDAVLCTTGSLKFKGLQPHQDIYPPPNGETGQLQALVYVHPPPAGYSRLGLAAAYYPLCDKRLWRDYMQALLCRQSTTPDLDLRHAARPSLGSKPTQRNAAIIGGPVLEKKAVKQMTDHEVIQAAKKTEATAERSCNQGVHRNSFCARPEKVSHAMVFLSPLHLAKGRHTDV